MTLFADTLNPTPFSFFDADVSFQTEADSLVTFVKRAMGDDTVSVELTKKQIWACLEESFLEYSAIVNTHQAKNQLQSFLGTSTGSLSGSEQKYIRETLTFLERQAEPYASLAGVGGSYNHVLGKISLSQGIQDYDLTTALVDGNGNALYGLQPSGSKTRMRVIEVMHFSPAAAYRFFDSTSAINYLNNEFSFESFTPETIFYVLPVFEDILRAQQFSISQRVRRSNYSYELIGTRLRIYPSPTSATSQNLYVKVMFAPDPVGVSSFAVTESSGRAYTSGMSFGDDTIYGVSNISNIPFGNLSYAKVNSVGRQWVRQYALALSRELLGLVRSKFQSIPIPNAELTLNGTELVAQGREDKDKLKTELKEMLDSMTYEQMMTRSADKTDALFRQLRGVPFPRPLTMG